MSGGAVIVAGATGTIGTAIVRSFARSGARLGLIGRRPDALRSLADQASDDGAAAARTATADLRDADALERGVAELVAELAPIGVLAHAAGDAPRGDLDALTRELWETAFAVKLIAAWQLVALCRPHFATEASVVFVVGESAHQPDPQFALGAVNAALVHLVKTLAASLGPDGVRVNGVSPGPVAGPRFDARRRTHAAAGDPAGERWASEFAGRLPLGRLVDPDEVAQAVGYLADARAVTGEILSVSVGRSARRL